MNPFQTFGATRPPMSKPFRFARNINSIFASFALSVFVLLVFSIILPSFKLCQWKERQKNKKRNRQKERKEVMLRVERFDRSNVKERRRDEGIWRKEEEKKRKREEDKRRKWRKRERKGKKIEKRMEKRWLVDLTRFLCLYFNANT